MTTMFRLDPEGGFTVADTAEQVTVRAHPGSLNAEAARSNPQAREKLAEQMIAVEELARRQNPRDWTRDLDTENMERLRAGQADGSTVSLEYDSDQAMVREGRAEARHHANRELEGLRDNNHGFDPNAPGSAAIGKRDRSKQEPPRPSMFEEARAALDVSRPGPVSDSHQRPGLVDRARAWLNSARDTADDKIADRNIAARNMFEEARDSVALDVSKRGPELNHDHGRDGGR